MSNLAESRQEDYGRALSLASVGEDEAALDILWELRLKVDLSIYRRALVNLTIAAILRRADRTKYAQEYLDLIDLLRQQHANTTIDEEELEHIKDMENTAKDIIDTAAATNAPVDSTPQRTAQDANTGLLIDGDLDTTTSAAMTVTHDMQGSSALPEAAENTSDTDEGVVWVSEPRAPLENIPEDLPTIEGFLRDESYTPFAPFAPYTPSTSTAGPRKISEAKTEDVTPASFSPSQDHIEH